MAKLSNAIEDFIKVLFNKCDKNEIQIQRNELANKFNCAPSQINYVLTTRFSYNRGYVIESKRGGGGYIIIKKVGYQTGYNKNRIIIEQIGKSITYNDALSLINNLYENNILDDTNFNVIKIALNDRTLQSTEHKNKVRADILRAIIMVLI